MNSSILRRHTERLSELHAVMRARMLSIDTFVSRLMPADRPWSLWRTSMLSGLVVVAIQAAFLLIGSSGFLHGTLFDPDCYMHLQRALRAANEGWQQALDPRVNAPDGYTIHWTALFDILLVAGAAPLRLLGLSLPDALYVWGGLISPVLLVAALSVLAWGVRRRVDGTAFLWLTVLVFTQPQFSGAFIIGRPDHHSLVFGLLVAQIAWLYVFFDGRAKTCWALTAGALAGVQLCTSVEGLLTILMVLSVLTLSWLLYGARALRTVCLYLSACVATSVGWLAWEGWRYLFVPAYDRVSLVHVTALCCGLLAFGFLAFANGRGWIARAATRWTVTATSFSCAGLITALIFPDFFLGPWPHLDPAVVAWHRSINELQPLLPTDPRHLATFLAQFTAPLLSLPLVIQTLVRGPHEEKPVMLVSLIGMVLFGALALAQMRWSGEVQAAALLPWTLTTQHLMQSRISLAWRKVNVPLRSFALSGALLLQMVPAALAGRPTHAEDLVAGPGSDARRGCAWTRATNALDKAVPGDGIVMTSLWYGPEILWRTQHRVVGAPYEIPPALRDTNTFMDGDEGAARSIALKRHIDFVLICRNDSLQGFSAQLARGAAPAWLTPVRLDGDLGEFRLYRVVGL
jgi:hypothetical protein